MTDSKVDPNVSDSPFTMYIACGPYTHDTDLMYKPWRALLKNIENTKPTVVLLVSSVSNFFQLSLIKCCILRSAHLSTYTIQKSEMATGTQHLTIYFDHAFLTRYDHG